MRYNDQYDTEFISLILTNLYDQSNYDLETSHVLPALICRFSEAKEAGDTAVNVWGTGKPKSFCMLMILADACVFYWNLTKKGNINMGTGKDISISELAELIAEVVGFRGEISFDTINRRDAAKIA